MPRLTNGKLPEGSSTSPAGSLPRHDKPSLAGPLVPIIGPVKHITGSKLWINPHLMEVLDPQNHKLYFYGGEDPGSPVADLHVLDTVTMKIKDLSSSFSSRKPQSSLCARANSDNNPKRLPVITSPAFIFLNMNDTNFLFLFGGYENGKASSDLIVIDVDHLQWWREPVEGKVRPRLNAAIAAVGEKIFVFGGFERLLKAEDENWQHLSSYCILEYIREPAKEAWKWVASDVPYPAHVASTNSKFGDAIPVYEGREILLTPARQSPYREADFTSNMCYFNTENKTFQPINAVAGSLPENLAWYYAWTFTPQTRGDVRIDNGSSNTSASQKKKSRPAPYPALKGHRHSSAAIDTSSHRESLLICGWNPLNFEDDSFTPDLWQLNLFPGHKMTCFNISEKLKDLGAEFHRFVVIDSRILLLGDRNKKRLIDMRRKDEEVEMELLNGYVDITIQNTE